MRLVTLLKGRGYLTWAIRFEARAELREKITGWCQNIGVSPKASNRRRHKKGRERRQGSRKLPNRVTTGQRSRLPGHWAPTNLNRSRKTPACDSKTTTTSRETHKANKLGSRAERPTER